MALGCLTATSSLIHVYSCTESRFLSDLLSPSRPLLLPCHLASSSPLLSPCCLTLIWTLVFLSLPVPCLSHTNTSADVVGNAKPVKGSHEGGREPGAGKSHDRSPRSGSTKTHLSQLQSVPSCQQSPPPTAFSHFLWEIRHSKEPNCGSDTLEFPVRVAEWLSTNLFPSWFTEDLGVRGAWGHLHTWLLFRFKSGSMSEDLSLRCCSFYFTMGF